MRLFFQKPARRLISLAIILFFALPLGLSVSGCKKALTTDYCNGGDSGPVVGQVSTITLSPSLATYGESLNYTQIGQSLSASAQDCKGNSVSVRSFTYASSNMQVVDINPNTGQTCAGVWNRFTGGGIPDYTTCQPYTTPPSTYVAYVTATGSGAVSNAIPVFIHPVVTSIVIGTATPTAQCSTTNDPSTNCCPLTYTAPTIVNPYDPAACVSQAGTAQLTARVYANGVVSPANNITCQVGHVGFATQGASGIATIDENGVITANQPGSATITATISATGSGSTAGFFSTCPPKTITLTTPNNGTGNVTVALNNAQPFNATVLDTAGNPITGLSLEYESTTQQTVTPSGNDVTPVFPGSATITAVCNPGTCNPAPFSQIGYLSNGTPLTSNGITVTATGTSATVLYIGSTGSQYLYPVDFTTSQPAGLIKLPYVPNSMVINPAGTTIYLGSSSALMEVTTANNSLSSTNTLVVGTVLAVSPDGTTLVTTDPNRKTVSLLSNSGNVEATNNGVGTRAQFSPDSQTVYITGTDQSGNPQLLVHNTFTSWTAIPLTTTTAYNDVTVTVPHVGAYFAGGSLTYGRSYCPSSTTTSAVPPVVTNSFYPLADEPATPSDRITATTDGLHLLAASSGLSTLPTTAPLLSDIAVSNSSLQVQNICPKAPAVIGPGYFTSTVTKHPLTGISATAITAVTAATNSAVSFVTYLNNAATAGALPMYLPPTQTLSNVTLASTTAGVPTAPVYGIFASDNNTFYAGTAGDNAVHLIALTYPSSGPPAAADNAAGIITPNLPCATTCSSTIATPNLLVQRPKKSTE